MVRLGWFESHEEDALQRQRQRVLERSWEAG